jgi:hypothetical protein
MRIRPKSFWIHTLLSSALFIFIQALSHVKYLAVVLLLLLPQDEKEAEEDLAEMEAMLYCKLHYLEYQVTEGIFSY